MARASPLKNFRFASDNTCMTVLDVWGLRSPARKEGRMRLLALVVVSVFFAAGLASHVSAQSGPYSQVVDNSSKARFSAPEGWKVGKRSQSYGAGHRFARPSRIGDPARFKVRVPETGNYSVYLRWPARNWYNSNTLIGVRTTSGYRWTHVNQQKNGGRWVKVGTYRMGSGDRYRVRVSRRSGSKGYVVADAVKVVEASVTPSPYSMLGSPIHSRASVERYARSVGSTKYIMRAIPLYYELAPKVGIRPDVLVAQAMVETGRGHYGGDSRPWNMAGIKKGGDVGDEPRDFEKPATAREGVRMHVNHMAAYTGKEPLGKPHARFQDARAAQESRGWWVRRVGHLGDGIWATDPTYAGKIRRILNDMGGS